MTMEIEPKQTNKQTEPKQEPAARNREAGYVDLSMSQTTVEHH